MRKCECGNSVANNARFCPECGRHFTNTAKKFFMIILAVPVLFLILVAILAEIYSSNRTPITAAAPPAVQSNPVNISAKPPTGYRNFEWGSPPRAGFRMVMEPTDEGVAFYTVLASKTPESLFDLPVAEEAYTFVYGKFCAGNAFLEGETNFQKMKSTLVNKFGNPTFANENLRTYTWRWPQERIEVSLNIEAKSARSTVTFSNTALRHPN